MEDIQAILIVLIAGVVVGKRDLAGSLAEQSFLLEALLLELSDLAAASVEASFFIGDNHAQFVSETALVAGMAGGAVDASVESEDML